MAVNATGNYLVTKAFLPAMIDNGWGRIVNMSSVSAPYINIRVGATDESEAALAAGIPVGRTATTEEVAAVITFLSSEGASSLTGTTVDINGGSHIH